MEGSGLQFESLNTAYHSIPSPSLKFGESRLDLSQFDDLTQREHPIFQDSIQPPNLNSVDFSQRPISLRSLSPRRGSSSLNTTRTDQLNSVEQSLATRSEPFDHPPSSNGPRRSNLCHFDGGCRRRAVFGDPNAKAPRHAMFCAQHRRPTDRDVANRACSHPSGCQRPAYYGPVNGGPERFCSTHRQPSHVNLRCAPRPAVWRARSRTCEAACTRCPDLHRPRVRPRLSPGLATPARARLRAETSAPHPTIAAHPKPRATGLRTSGPTDRKRRASAPVRPARTCGCG
jgi:hypothetical protein